MKILLDDVNYDNAKIALLNENWTNEENKVSVHISDSYRVLLESEQDEQLSVQYVDVPVAEDVKSFVLYTLMLTERTGE